MLWVYALYNVHDLWSKARKRIDADDALGQWMKHRQMPLESISAFTVFVFAVIDLANFTGLCGVCYYLSHLEWTWQYGCILAVALGFIYQTKARDTGINCPFIAHLPYIGNLWYVLAIILEGDFDLSFHDFGTLNFVMNDFKPWTLSFPFGTTINIFVHPQQAEHILGPDGFYDFVKGDEQRELIGPLLGRGIFVSDGHEWMRQRKTAARMFKTSRMRDYMFKIFDRTSHELVDKIRALSESEGTVDLFDLFNRMTLDAFTESAFGYDMKNVATAPETIPFMRAMDYSQAIIVRRFVVADLWRVFRFFGLFWEPRLDGYLKTIDEFVTSVIEERLKARRECHEQSDYGDLLSLFLDDKDLKDDEKSMQSLRDVILNFILAGRDTTAQTLSWMMYELAKNPGMLSKAREEVDAAERLNFQTVSKGLPYIEALMNETLRMHTVVPAALKYPVKNTCIPHGESEVPVLKGELVVLHPFTLNKNPSVWKDPFTFKPERFIGTKQHSIYKPYQHLVFNAGVRTCLGRDFAYLEVKMCAALMLQNFEFELVDPSAINFLFAFTIPMKNGLRVKVTDRESG